ncbi:hypothetical protein D9M72_373450 [compost metagenome]
MPRQAFARPDLAPSIARDEVLEFLVERGQPRERTVHVRAAQHLAPHGKAGVVARMIIGDRQPAAHEIEQRCREAAGLLEAGNMRGGQFDKAGAGNRIGQRAAFLRRGRRVLAAGDDQHRHLDRRDRLAEIGVAHGRATGRIAARIEAGEHIAQAVERALRRGGKPRREPALD